MKKASDDLMPQGSPFDPFGKLRAGRLRVSGLAVAPGLVLRQAQDERWGVRVMTERCLREAAQRARAN